MALYLRRNLPYCRFVSSSATTTTEDQGINRKEQDDGSLDLDGSTDVRTGFGAIGRIDAGKFRHRRHAAVRIACRRVPNGSMVATDRLWHWSALGADHQLPIVALEPRRKHRCLRMRRTVGPRARWPVWRLSEVPGMQPKHQRASLAQVIQPAIGLKKAAVLAPPVHRIASCQRAKRRTDARPSTIRALNAPSIALSAFWICSKAR